MLELDDEVAEASWDDEDFDELSEDFDESEFLLDLLNPGKLISGIGQTVGNLFRPPSRPPAPTVNVPPSAGVNHAVVNTPRGQANVQLGAAVVSKDEFNAAIARLQSTINADSGRINTLQKDLQAMGARVGSAVTETHQAIAKNRNETKAELLKLRRATRSALRRARSDQQQQQMMNMVMSLMTQQQLSSRFDDHVHSVTGTSTSTPTGADGDDDGMMMMLPMMMMSQPSGGGGDNSMAMMMMAIALSGSR